MPVPQPIVNELVVPEDRLFVDIPKAEEDIAPVGLALVVVLIVPKMDNEDLDEDEKPEMDPEEVD